VKVRVATSAFRPPASLYPRGVASNTLVQVVGIVLRGAINLATGEISGRLQRASADEQDMPTISEEFEMPPAFAGVAGSDGEDLPRLPSLDADHELGDTFASSAERESFPPNLLDVVVGLEHEKRVIRTVVTSQNYRLHVLMVGPPGSAKSLILDLVRQGLPDEARIVVGNQASAAGIKNLLLDQNHPRVLLFEELDKAPREVQEALLTSMDGVVTNAIGTAGGQAENLSLEVHIIAAANDIRAIIAPLLQRFTVLHLRDYTPAERHEVMLKILEQRMDFTAPEAKEIADMVAPVGTIRDAEHIGGLWKEDPEVARDHAARLGKR